MAEEQVEAITTEAEVSEPSVLDRLLHRKEEQPATVEAGDCYNCSVQGAGVTKLVDGVCPKCGFTAPRG